MQSTGRTEAVIPSEAADAETSVADESAEQMGYMFEINMTTRDWTDFVEAGAAIKDLDCENLLVQAPAELGTAFGGSGPVWFDIVAATATLKKSGWRSSDKRAAELELQQAREWGKWEESDFEFAACNIVQKADGTMFMDQKIYTEVSAIRGALGTVAWRANQVSPQFLEDVGLMHFEVPLPVPVASVDLILRINKVIQEAKRMADQTLVSILLTRAAMVTWADAAQNKGVNKGSTIGMLTCIAPIRILEDDRVPMNIVAWRIQSEGTKGVWLDIHGHPPVRGRQDEMVKNTSALYGLGSSRSGYELTIAVKQAVASGTPLRWVTGTKQLADAMTKGKVEDLCCTMWQLAASLVHGEYSKDFWASRCSFAVKMVSWGGLARRWCAELERQLKVVSYQVVPEAGSREVACLAMRFASPAFFFRTIPTSVPVSAVQMEYLGHWLRFHLQVMASMLGGKAL
ncbi:hypothetical protein AK812_SmicGene33262 [Symbiodinium microadriaticum]|uniref:Uncharacterized protein n=1 Tax=Symbiodinium microadriaticum TaxID=2951 RepID=A0A1Q9CS26_SYMMI|nr:hypothetical protein AK812_SmicGene33262 [Symbiodinium microadriaticum]